MSNSESQQKIFGSIALVASIVVIGFWIWSRANQPPLPDTPVQSAEMEEPKPIDPHVQDSLDLETIRISTFFVDDFAPDQYREDNKVILDACKALEECEHKGLQFANSESPEVKAAADALLKKVKATRIKHFPSFRKKWAEIAGRNLWENDVYITVSGKGSSTLNFVGFMFATNQNIKETQEAIYDGLHTLRFKMVTYRWYKDADEYQYIKIESPADSE